jgi:hypothetical protein
MTRPPTATPTGKDLFLGVVSDTRGLDPKRYRVRALVSRRDRRPFTDRDAASIVAAMSPLPAHQLQTPASQSVWAAHELTASGLDPARFTVRVVVDRCDGTALTDADLTQIQAAFPANTAAASSRKVVAKRAAARTAHRQA